MELKSCEKKEKGLVNFQSIGFDKSFYRPGEDIGISITIANQGMKENCSLCYSVTTLDRTIYENRRMITLEKGENSFRVLIDVDLAAPRGYGIDFKVYSMDETLLTTATKGFDVLFHWTDTPRYGFLTDFVPGRNDCSETIQDLTLYHINGLQFYDWMYRHDQFLTDKDPYIDPLGRKLSLVTVKEFIATAHKYNIAAMPYTAIYAASVSFFKEHSEMALYDKNGMPVLLGTNYLVYMNPKEGSLWLEHLMNQFFTIMQSTDFDGIHLDQYGDPKIGYDSQRNEFDLAASLAHTINLTKEVVDDERKDGTVIFNAVNNWPIENVALSNQNLIYIEVWPPHDCFSDLHQLIIRAQKLSGQKPVVIAAYIDPAFQHNVLLMDAVIFASGGSHIEIGEKNVMLAEAYFPSYKPIPDELSTKLIAYYDFMVRYQDVIGPRTSDGTISLGNSISFEGYSSSASLCANKIWPIIRKSRSFTAVNLINLVGVELAEWKSELSNAPSLIQDLVMNIQFEQKLVKHILFASPDLESYALQELEYSSNEGEGLQVNIPALYYWDLILIEWEI